MTIEVIGAVAFVLGTFSLFAGSPNLILYVFFAATLLGAAAALVLDSLGGTTVQPAHLLLGFLALELLSKPHIRAAIVRAVSFGTPGFWLLATACYATLTAYLMPRLFQGETLAFAVRAQGNNFAAPLVPTTSNLTQSIYFIADTICFLVLFAFGTTQNGRKCLARCALMCVVLNLMFAGLDLLTYATGTTELLSFIRNSTYSVLSDNESAGFKRIIGSFVEASSFSYWTLGYFAFALSLWLNGYATRLTLFLGLLSFAALLFSTSTTAYVGLAIYLSFQFAFVAVKLLAGPVRPQMLAFLLCVPFMLCLAVILICLNDNAYAAASNLLDTFVLGKMSSSSGIERSSWNSQAIQNFFDTFGLGAGNGSVRASSFTVALIGSLGLPGALLYATFLLTIWFGRRGGTIDDATYKMQTAARSACLAWLIAASTSAGLIDLGLPFFAFAALATAREVGSRKLVPAAQSEVAGGREISEPVDLALPLCRRVRPRS
jgi:hypothetical protein